jgi:hypothetical protein
MINNKIIVLLLVLTVVDTTNGSRITGYTIVDVQEEVCGILLSIVLDVAEASLNEL